MRKIAELHCSKTLIGACNPTTVFPYTNPRYTCHRHGLRVMKCPLLTTSGTMTSIEDDRRRSGVRMTST